LTSSTAVGPLEPGQDLGAGTVSGPRVRSMRSSVFLTAVSVTAWLAVGEAWVAPGLRLSGLRPQLAGTAETRLAAAEGGEGLDMIGDGDPVEEVRVVARVKKKRRSKADREKDAEEEELAILLPPAMTIVRAEALSGNTTIDEFVAKAKEDYPWLDVTMSTLGTVEKSVVDERSPAALATANVATEVNEDEANDDEDSKGSDAPGTTKFRDDQLLEIWLESAPGLKRLFTSRSYSPKDFNEQAMEMALTEMADFLRPNRELEIDIASDDIAGIKI